VFARFGDIERMLSSNWFSECTVSSCDFENSRSRATHLCFYHLGRHILLSFDENKLRKSFVVLKYTAYENN
jgi:hypothetical protein